MSLLGPACQPAAKHLSLLIEYFDPLSRICSTPMSISFGQPDPSILFSGPKSDFPTFESFKFQSIGKEPELLKRISNREEGVQYQYSPSPEPEPQPIHAVAEARTRPSLLQALTSQDNATSSTKLNQGESSISSSPFMHPPPPTAKPTSYETDYESMQLQYPETPHPDPVPSPKRIPSLPPTPPPPPFVPDFPALRAVHARLTAAHDVLASVPPKELTPPPETPSPALLSATATAQNTHQAHTIAQTALMVADARTAVAEAGVSGAQRTVDMLEQALIMARTTLDAMQRALLDTRTAAVEARAAVEAARTTAEAAEETKRILELPPPVRAPEPEDPRVETVAELKRDLEVLKGWAEEQETTQLRMVAVVARREERSRERERERQREEEEEREASKLMIDPDGNDTDGQDGASSPVVERSSQVEARIEVDEPCPDSDESRRISEERRSAAQILVSLAEQKTIEQNNQRKPQAMVAPEDLRGKDKTRPSPPAARTESLRVEVQGDEAMSLAREEALRKMQDAKREQVRIQKEQAQAAAAISILKERQEAKNRESSAQASPSSAQPISQRPRSDPNTAPQFGNVVASAVLFPPSTSVDAKAKAKKKKPISEGALLTHGTTTAPDPSLVEPSPALERAAALGLRAPKSVNRPAPDSAANKARTHSLPPLARMAQPPSPVEEISVYRTGPDAGDVPILQPSKAPKLEKKLVTDVQLMNMRFALQDEGITWEAISRSRPVMAVVKTEQEDPSLRPVNKPLPLPARAQLSPPFPRAPPPPPAQPLPTKGLNYTSASGAVGDLPLAIKKPLPKFTKKVVEMIPSANTTQSPAVNASMNNPLRAAPAEVVPAQSRTSDPRTHLGDTNSGNAYNAGSVYGAASTSSTQPPVPIQGRVRMRTDSFSHSSNSSRVQTPVTDTGYSPASFQRPERSLRPSPSGIPDAWLRRRTPPEHSANRTGSTDRYDAGTPPESFGRQTPNSYGGRSPSPHGFRRSSLDSVTSTAYIHKPTPQAIPSPLAYPPKVVSLKKIPFPFKKEPSPPAMARRSLSPPRYNTNNVRRAHSPPPPPPRTWTPQRARSPPRGLTPPRARSPPRTRSPPRARSPPPQNWYTQPAETTRNLSGGDYSYSAYPPSSSSYAPPHTSPPPKGPRAHIPKPNRAASNPNKRPREDDYTPPVHPTKRFRDDEYWAPPADPSPPRRHWTPRETEQPARPALELRLGAPDPNVNFIGRGESYRPRESPDEWSHSGPEGLLSRLSEPNYEPSGNRGMARGRGRGAPNRARGGGRGRGARSLADRLADTPQNW
ncbi:hypothetical protein C8J57DRAFT_738661 [Mycena rebaudengoi]|nr:hypothetical protein C8J57DRAFT_738661 [Mycena rebaudengoi]